MQSFLGLIGSLFIFHSILSLRTDFILMYTATALFKRYQSEKCCSNVDTVATGAGSTTAVAKTSICFLTSGSSVQISPKDRGCAGHAFSSPVNQCCCSVNVLASKPLDASSARFSRVYVTLLVRGGMITYQLDAVWLFLMYRRTVVESV